MFNLRILDKIITKRWQSIERKAHKNGGLLSQKSSPCFLALLAFTLCAEL